MLQMSYPAPLYPILYTDHSMIHRILPDYCGSLFIETPSLQNLNMLSTQKPKLLKLEQEFPNSEAWLQAV